MTRARLEQLIRRYLSVRETVEGEGWKHAGKKKGHEAVGALTVLDQVIIDLSSVLAQLPQEPEPESQARVDAMGAGTHSPTAMEEPAGSVRGPHYPLGELDAAKWAAEFVRLFGGDEGLMLGWFANAIMTGYDEAMRRQSPAAREAGGDVAARAHPEGKAKDDASEAAMAAPEVPCANGHVWTHQFGDDWTPETGTSCDCGKKKWGIPLAVAQEPGPPVTVEPKP